MQVSAKELRYIEYLGACQPTLVYRQVSAKELRYVAEQAVIHR